MVLSVVIVLLVYVCMCFIGSLVLGVGVSCVVVLLGVIMNVLFVVFVLVVGVGC